MKLVRRQTLSGTRQEGDRERVVFAEFLKDFRGSFVRFELVSHLLEMFLVFVHVGQPISRSLSRGMSTISSYFNLSRKVCAPMRKSPLSGAVHLISTSRDNCRGRR